MTKADDDKERDRIAIKTRAHHWTIVVQNKPFSGFCQAHVVLWSGDGEVLWASKTRRFFAGDEEKRKKTAITAAKTKILNVHSGYETEAPIQSIDVDLFYS